MFVMYAIRHIASGQFVGPGLKQTGPMKLWAKLGSARNATAAYGRNARTRAGYEVVEIKCAIGRVILDGEKGTP